MEVIPIVLRYVFSFFIFHIFKWYNQEGVWLTSVEMKNTLPSFKYGFVRKIAYARDLYGLFALESILSEGKKLSEMAQSSNYNPDSFQVLSWFKCYIGDPVKAALLLALFSGGKWRT